MKKTKNINGSKEILYIAITILFSAIAIAMMFLSDEFYVNKLTESFDVYFFRVLLLLVVFVTIMLSLLYMLRYENIKFVENKKYFVLIVSAIVFSMAIGFLLSFFFGNYLRPLVLAAILTAALVGKRIAIYVNYVISLLMLLIDVFISNLAVAAIIPVVISFVCGGIMVMGISRDDSRLASVFTSIKMMVIYAAMAAVLNLAFSQDLASGELIKVIIYSSLSPVVSLALFLSVLPVFEKVFNLLTPYRITELTDINKGLLYELSVKAPGTFNHSMTVASLTGACAVSIGEDARLARAMAYYHDIGKLYDPNMFKENQTTKDVNPHDKLTPELSVALIKKHVVYGGELIKKRGLPREFVNAAIEHHGTLPIKVFYIKAKKFNEGFLDISDYSYEGPTPSSKIAAIIMICDAAEAFVRTLSDRSRKSVDDAVRSVIEERMELEQFNACDITFKDLSVIRKTIVDNFAGMFHERIEYPKFKITREEGKSV